MLVKTLLKSCGTGFNLVIIADRVSGHTMEYSSVEEARVKAGSNNVIEWEVGFNMGSRAVGRRFVLLITI